MRSIPTGNPDRIAFRQPLGWSVIFLMPAFLAVLAITLYYWLSPHGLLHDWPHDFVSTVIVVGFASLSVLSLLSFARDFMRLGVVIDRSAGTVECQSGWLIPVRRPVQMLGAFTHLSIDTILVRHRRYKELFYVLDLIPSDGGPPARIGKSTKYLPIRAMADQVGEFLPMTTVDMTARPPVMIVPGIARPMGAGPMSNPATPGEMQDRIGPVPPNMKAKCSLQGDRLIIDTAPPNARAAFAAIALSWAGAAAGLLYLHAAFALPWGAIALFGGIAGFILLVFSSIFWPQWQTIEADRVGVKLSVRGLLLTSRKELAREQIREVRADAGAIEMIGRDRILRCQFLSVSRDDVRWAAQAIEAVMAE